MKHSWRHAAAALALLGAVFAIFIMTVLMPLHAKRGVIEARIEQTENHIARLDTMIARRPALEAEIARLSESEVPSEAFLSSQTPTLAAAELQQRVKELIDASGGRLVSSQAVESTEAAVFPAVTIRAHATGTLDTVSRALHAVESSQPLLLIDDLQIQRANALGASDASDVSIDLQFDVTGYLYVAAP